MINIPMENAQNPSWGGVGGGGCQGFEFFSQ